MAGLAPPAPNTLQKLVFDDNCVHHELSNGSNKIFLLHDSSCDDNNRILIFGKKCVGDPASFTSLVC